MSRTTAWLACTIGIVFPTAVAAQEPDAPESSPEVAAMGRVVDLDMGTPVVGAYVAFEGLRWGVYTDSTGLFYMRDPKGGSDRITISMLGYGTTYVPSHLVDAAPPVRIPVKSDPIVLEGFEIVSDRFKRRRNAVASMSVRAFDERQLRASSATDIVQFLEARSFLRPVDCGLRACARVRGRVTQVLVCLDEVPLLGSLDMLRTIMPADLEMAEVYGSGRQIRLYTRAFMEGASRNRINPHPIEYGC